ncbi:MAG: MFS transporter [Terriglobales bacterium]
MKSRRDLVLVYVAAGLRSAGTGLMGVLLGVHLARAGFSATRIGLIIAAGLAGITAATLVLSFGGDRLGRRRTLVIFSALTAVGGMALALTTHASVLVPAAVIGMLNATGTDRSAAFALEQAVIPGLVPDRSRTWALSGYNVVLDGTGAAGALAAALPAVLQQSLGFGIDDGYRLAFAGFAVLNVAAAVIYLFCSDKVEVHMAGAPAAEVSPQTRGIVAKLAALFALDSLGGGFLTDALVSYWFFQRFGVSVAKLGVIFAVVHLLNAASHMGAAWLSRRIGLLNTMVFTHLPSSIFLIAVPFAPTFRWATIFFFLRESLVEMDVPTRQSYVAAVVQPHERTFASAVTNLSRNVLWAVGSSIAGALMQHVAFSAPLVAGGGLKIIYDGLLYRAFRRVKPAEERAIDKE